MTSLSDRVEAATGADRELDALIGAAVTPLDSSRVIYGKGCRMFLTPGPGRTPFHVSFGKGVRFGILHKEVRYTASLDAAMSLVPEGWSILFAWNGERCVADVHTKPIGNPDGVWPAHSSACSPALALTAASLRARGL